MFLKLLLVIHAENVTSDHKLLNLAYLHLGIRAFVGLSYGLEQPLPWHSTRQRIQVSVFETYFGYIVGLCIQKGLLSGHIQVIDAVAGLNHIPQKTH